MTLAMEFFNKRIIRKLIALLFFLFSSKLFAYDYPWAVDYVFKYNTLKKVNETVQNFIYEHPEIQVFKTNGTDYLDEQKVQELKEDDLQLYLIYHDMVPYGEVLMGCIYLKDVDTVAIFRIIPISSSSSNVVYIRLYGYGKNILYLNRKIILTPKGIGSPFNDVEPNEEQEKIKESFERNFLDSLSLDWEYVDPGSLDRIISKIMRSYKDNKFLYFTSMLFIIVIFIFIKFRNK